MFIFFLIKKIESEEGNICQVLCPLHVVNLFTFLKSRNGGLSMAIQFNSFNSLLILLVMSSNTVTNSITNSTTYRFGFISFYCGACAHLFEFRIYFLRFSCLGLIDYLKKSFTNVKL